MAAAPLFLSLLFLQLAYYIYLLYTWCQILAQPLLHIQLAVVIDSNKVSWLRASILFCSRLK
jgi:hypothetical protein